jgi:hypothetical protein
MLIITDDPVKKNGAKKELRIVVNSPGLGVWPASMLFCQHTICMGAALGSQYGAMTVAVEILIAQLPSQSKLTTAWHENRKIRYENELLKAKEPAPDV